MTKNKDPLHFSREELSVNVGSYSMTLSSRFLDRQNAWENLDEIKDHFTIKFELFTEMEKTDETEELRELADKITQNEFIIQELFNFDRDARFHRFWELPKCECPRMDNMDSWGTGRSVTSSNCKIHWRTNEN